MADVHPTPPHAGKVGGFLQQSTAGLPNWAWVLVIGAGIAAAIIVPKYLNQGQASSTTSSSGNGLGLAVDPTTGLPYAVEGLVPSGGNAGGGTTATGGGGGTSTQPPTTGSNLASVFTRALQPGASPPNDIPIWKTPNVDWSQDVGGIPINTTVQVGPPVKTGNQTFYPVNYNGTSGYIGSWDLAGLPTNFTTWPYANSSVYGGSRSG